MTRIWGTNGEASVLITERNPNRFWVSGTVEGWFKSIETAKRAVSQSCGKGPHRWTWTAEPKS